MIVSWFGFVPTFVRVEPIFFDYVFLISSCWVHSIWKEFEDLRKRKEQWIKASYTVWCVECHYLSEAEAAPPPSLPLSTAVRAHLPSAHCHSGFYCVRTLSLCLSHWIQYQQSASVCVCVSVSLSTTFTHSVLCVVCLSVFWITTSPPNHLTAPHSARPLLDFRITSRKWVCSTCVKLSCAVFLLSQR